jgi:hypothetical protein
MDAEGPGDCGSGVFTAEVNGIGDRWSGYTTMDDTHTQFEAFLRDFGTRDIVPHLDFWSTSIWIKGILGH